MKIENLSIFYSYQNIHPYPWEVRRLIGGTFLVLVGGVETAGINKSVGSYLL